MPPWIYTPPPAPLDEFEVLVFDIGNTMTRVGIATDVAFNERPQLVFPTLVGEKNGDDPVNYGHVENIAMTLLFEHTFEQLNVESDENPVMLTNTAFNPEIELTGSILFETYRTPSVSFQEDTLCSLHALELSTGLVIHSGHGYTFVSAIHEDNVISKSRLDVAGRALDDFFAKSFAGHQFQTPSEMITVRDIKEKLAYVAQDYGQEVQSFPAQTPKFYNLPNGLQIEIGDESFEGPELLFKPPSIYADGPEPAGVHQLVNRAIQLCDESIRPTICSNIVLSGGTTVLSGFSERLEKELKKLVPNQDINIIAREDRATLAWTGAMRWASQREYREERFLTREEYEEHGERALTNFFRRQ